MVASFLGGGQLNPFSADPMALLSTSAMQGDQTPPVQAPAFADPQTTGAISSGPAPAQPAAAGGDNRGIMDRIGDAFSGRAPLFGSPSADDNEIDPMTGAPKGLARQAGMRSMMQMGLTFLLAGQRMSNDQRAAILTKAPGLIGGGDEALNSFAKTRLEMAKLRMEQQKMQQEQQSQAALMKGLGLDGDSAPTPTAGAQGVQAGQQALAQAAPAVDPSQAAPAAGDPSQAMPAPAQAGALAAPGGVPRVASMGGAGAGFDPKSLTQAEKLAIVSQPTTAGKAQMFGTIAAARAAGERIGEPQYNSVTGTIQYPKYNGRGEQTGFADGGKPTTTTQDTPDGKYRLEGFTDPTTGKFITTKKTDIGEDPATARLSKAEIDGTSKDRDTLKENYETNIQKGVQTYDKMQKVRADIDAGKGVFGTGADLRRQAYNALATLGYNFDNKLTGDLNTTANFERLMKQGVAGVIKDFNGSQNVSDSDRKFAVDVMQAAATGNRESVKNALDNAMQDIRDNVTRYNANAKSHNELVQGSFEGNLRKRYTVPTIDRDLSAPQQQQAAPQQSGSGLVRYERRDGKIVRVQD